MRLTRRPDAQQTKYSVRLIKVISGLTPVGFIAIGVAIIAASPDTGSKVFGAALAGISVLFGRSLWRAGIYVGNGSVAVREPLHRTKTVKVSEVKSVQILEGDTVIDIVPWYIIALELHSSDVIEASMVRSLSRRQDGPLRRAAQQIADACGVQVVIKQ